MLKRAFLPVMIFCALLSTRSAHAQYYFLNDRYYGQDFTFELGGSVGAMNAFTDLGGNKGIGKNFVKDFNLKNTRPSFGLYALATYREAIGVRLEGTFGSVQAYDSILKKDGKSTFGRYERNLSFRSRITDVQLSFEIHPLFFKMYSEDEAPFFSPYLVAGVGYFAFNPQAQLNGKWYDLQPLRTEGQGFAQYPDRKPYKLSQINIPVGVGLRYELTPSIYTRLEVVHRFLFTDYLDDVSTTYIDPNAFYLNLPPNLASIAEQMHNRNIPGSGYQTGGPGDQRGDSKDKDSYFTIQLKFGFVLRNEPR
ncbi:MAG: hypothetical protein J0G98_04810 [Terrimonas ferruginea]|uniref:DUF6089 family protein n=1 Tax=Terrimonas ferruginea TaxID=249 RepID=UPI000AAC154D|nr:DUF6089 family protein [Terrimonas ferruginea]MBN8782366.1 hypothetical protein [Terrimonas ferruginea]